MNSEPRVEVLPEEVAEESDLSTTVFPAALTCVLRAESRGASGGGG